MAKKTAKRKPRGGKVKAKATKRTGRKAARKGGRARRGGGGGG